MTQEPQKNHLRDYLRVVVVRRWVLIGVFLLSMLAALTYIFVQTPIYRAQAVLLIEPAKVNLTEFKGVYDPTFQLAGELARREFYETQYHLLVGRDLLERVYRKFGFGKTDEFRDEKEPLMEFRKRFGVSPVRRSRLVNVTFSWKDPELAARVVDYQVNEYMSDYRNRNAGVTTSGLDALREKAEELRPEVESKADQIQRFISSKNLVSLDKTANIIVDRLKEINRNLSEVERTRIEYESIYETIRQSLDEQRPVEDMPEVAVNDAIRDLKREYILVRQDVGELVKRFGPNHPEVKSSVARLKVTSSKLKQEMLNTMNGVKSQLGRAVKQEASLRTELREQERRVMNLNKQSAQYQLLKDSYETLNKTYNALTKRIGEIEVTMDAGLKEDNIFIISAPQVPVKPVKPNIPLSLALALAGGIFMGVTLCFVLEYFDTAVKTREDVEKVIAAPVIGYVPALVGNAVDKGYRGGMKPLELMAVDFGRSPLAESFRSIRTSLLLSSPNGSLKRIQVVSSVPREGKTLTSVNLAIAMARSGGRVLLIDADLRKPRIHKTFGISQEPGLSTVLSGREDVGLQDVVRPAMQIPNLHIVPSGAIPPDPAELLGSSRMKALLDEAGPRYDSIIFDTPPLTNVADAMIISRYVEGTLLVVRSFSTQRSFLEEASDLLSRGKVNLVGVVLNNVDMPRRGYYYGSYRYYQNSGYYGEGREGSAPSTGGVKRTGTA